MEDDPALMNHYLHFLSTGKIASKAPIINDQDEAAANDEEGMLLVHLYILGDKYKDIHFKNAIISAVVEKATEQISAGNIWFLGGKEIDVLYEKTSPGAALRRLVVDMWASEGEDDWAGQDLYNTDFLRDLAEVLLLCKDGLGDVQAWRNAADYYESDQPAQAGADGQETTLVMR